MPTVSVSAGRSRRTVLNTLKTLNGSQHALALNVFLGIVIAHWAEHLTQAIQIWGLGWETSQARGLLGLSFPWLITSEWLHYGYALIMLLALVTLRHGFPGVDRTWWNLALYLQAWHHLEHLLLLIQSSTTTYFFGGSVPTSVLQNFLPRVELHLFYNTIVTVPMVVAVVLHHRARRTDGSRRDQPAGNALRTPPEGR